jgi:transketolase
MDLQKLGIECTVINMSTLQPIDEVAIIKTAAETGAIVTAEEHLEHGGLSARVSQVVVKNRPVPMEFVTMKDYAMSGKPAELFARYGLTSQGIQEAVFKVLKRK